MLGAPEVWRVYLLYLWNMLWHDIHCMSQQSGLDTCSDVILSPYRLVKTDASGAGKSSVPSLSVDDVDI